jgi:hypothetical protein
MPAFQIGISEVSDLQKINQREKHPKKKRVQNKTPHRDQKGRSPKKSNPTKALFVPPAVLDIESKPTRITD